MASVLTQLRNELSSMVVDARHALREAVVDCDTSASIPIGHNYSLEVTVDDGALFVELGVHFPYPWGGNRDGGGMPIKHYLGGFGVSFGEVSLIDQGRDIFSFGVGNLLARFIYLK